MLHFAVGTGQLLDQVAVVNPCCTGSGCSNASIDIHLLFFIYVRFLHLLFALRFRHGFWFSRNRRRTSQIRILPTFGILRRHLLPQGRVQNFFSSSQNLLIVIFIRWGRQLWLSDLCTFFRRILLFRSFNADIDGFHKLCRTPFDH